MPPEPSVVLSVVVPVFREEASLPAFLTRLAGVLAAVEPEHEVIFALDPSPDRSGELILAARQADPRVKLLEFSRRVGQPNATLAGLRHASGEAVVVMDVDLQDPPELLGQMVALWREGYDVVLPRRRSRRGETLLKRLVAFCGYELIRRISEVEIPSHVGDFRLMSRRVVDEVCRLKERHGFLRGMVSLVGFRQVFLPFDRPERVAGEGNYSRLVGSLRIGLNGVFCFSTFPLAAVLALGLALTCAGSLLVFCSLALAWPRALVSLVVLLAGVQLLSVGILGEYIGRIYDEVRERPRYIIARAEGLSEGRR